MTKVAEVFRWRIWRVDSDLEEGLRFVVGCPGSRFQTADEAAEWARHFLLDSTADLRVLAIGKDCRSRPVKVVTDHPATMEAKAAAA
jgi:hypothetical protein